VKASSNFRQVPVEPFWWVPLAITAILAGAGFLLDRMFFP
jgi:hypothetical protein